MGYSRSQITLQRALDDIRPLLEGVDECSWRVSPLGAEGRWAYKIREALKLAQEASMTSIEYVVRPKYMKGLVIATRKNLKKLELIVTTGVSPTRTAHVDLTQEDERLESGTLSWLDKLHQAWQQRGTMERLHVPRIQLDAAMLKELYEDVTPEGLIFFYTESEGLTLMLGQGNEEAAEFAWRPDGEH